MPWNDALARAMDGIGGLRMKAARATTPEQAESQ